jgi:hypothetical protein
MYYYNEHYEPKSGLNNEKLFINMNDNSFEYKESNYNNSNLSRHLKELIEKNPLMPK